MGGRGWTAAVPSQGVNHLPREKASSCVLLPRSLRGEGPSFLSLWPHCWGTETLSQHNCPTGRMPRSWLLPCNSAFLRPEPCWVLLLPSTPCWISFFSVHLRSQTKLIVFTIWIIMVLNFLSFFKKKKKAFRRVPEALWFLYLIK